MHGASNSRHTRASRRVPTRRHSSSEYSSASPRQPNRPRSPLLPSRSRSPSPKASHYFPPSHQLANSSSRSRQDPHFNPQHDTNFQDHWNYHEHQNYQTYQDYHNNQYNFESPSPPESQRNTETDNSSEKTPIDNMSPPREGSPSFLVHGQPNQYPQQNSSEESLHHQNSQEYHQSHHGDDVQSPYHASNQRSRRRPHSPLTAQAHHDREYENYHTSVPEAYHSTSGDGEGAATQSDSDGRIDHHRIPGDASTEDESDQSQEQTVAVTTHQPQRQSRDRQKQQRQSSHNNNINRISKDHSSYPRIPSVWSRYHPVVKRASDVCSASHIPTTVISYARLHGTGKVSFDYNVRSRSITIGRAGYDADCQLKSDSKSVSRKHARLYWDSSVDRWMLACLSAKNGMIVDGAPIIPLGVPVALKSPTLIEIGDVSLYFLAPQGDTFRVNDIHQLEEQIAEARAADIRREKMRFGSDDQFEGQMIDPSLKSKTKTDRHIVRKIKQDNTTVSKVSLKKSPKVLVQQMPQEFSSEDVSDSEDEKLVVPEILDLPKYNLPVVQLVSGKRRKDGSKRGSKKRRKRDHSYDGDNSEQESKGRTDEWIKKEKTDFMRALFAVGVDAITNETGEVTGFNWFRFRRIADFPKKSDEMLEEHFRHVMADARALLDEEEREKKLKGARNTHRPNCECSVCENVRKSGKRRREDERGRDDARMKGQGRLMGLVTAQKLRVRLGMLEALLNLETDMAEGVFGKLEKNQSKSAIRDLPEWWKAGVHDRDLMRGCFLHGIGQWNEIWQNRSLQNFTSELRTCEARNEVMVWPTNQVAMKRVRELSSLLQAEMRKIAKHSALVAKDQRRDARRHAKKIARRKARERIGHAGGGTHNEDDWDDHHYNSSHNMYTGNSGDNLVSGYSVDVGDGDSTEDDSESEGHHDIASNVDAQEGAETEDDVEVEAEEDEMVTEDEQAGSEDNGSYNFQQGIHYNGQSSGEWDANQVVGQQQLHRLDDDDDDDNDIDGLETASESGSE